MEKWTLMYFEVDNSIVPMRTNQIQWLQEGKIGYARDGKELVRGEVLAMSKTKTELETLDLYGKKKCESRKEQTEKSTGKSKSKANKSERAKDSVKNNSGPEPDREMSQKETDVIKAFHERQASKMNNFNGFLVEKVDLSKNKKIKTKERKNFLEKSPKTNKPRFVVKSQASKSDASQIASKPSSSSKSTEKSKLSPVDSPQPQTVLSSTRNSPSSFNQELTEVIATTPIPSTEQSKLPLTSHSPSPVNQLSDTSLSKSSSPALSSTKHSFSTLSSISELSNTSSPKLSPRSNLLPSFSGQEDRLLPTASASHESGEYSNLAENAPKRSLSFSLQSEGKTPLPNKQTSKKTPVETIIARNATPDFIRIGSSPSRHDPPSTATSIKN
ncbi:uncharacterized protein DDB_G0284459-like [Clytia hemisphaerica]|uniref:uncharacterized protein DDB_G0284459-like n=1 Tax=Clytia hemisphaerica TaxID=252671 RepID=UPI0034D79FC7